MYLKEYFEDWLKVIDKKVLYEIINTLNSSNTVNLCPNYIALKLVNYLN